MRWRVDELKNEILVETRIIKTNIFYFDNTHIGNRLSLPTK